jgi:hypothetical protein
MLNSKAVIGWIDGENRHVSLRTINEYASPKIESESFQNMNATISRKDGATLLSFTVESGELLQGDTSFHLLWAFSESLGDFKTGAIPKHSKKGILTVDVNNGLQTNWLNQDSVKKLHAILMFTAWVLLAPIGAYLAIFFNRTEKETFFTAKWFPSHVVLMTLSILCTMAAITLVWVYRGFSYGPHEVFGMVLGILMLFQGMLGISANYYYQTTKAIVPETLHRIVGAIVLVGGLINCLLGIVKLRVFSGAFELILSSIVVFVLVPFLVSGYSKYTSKIENISLRVYLFKMLVFGGISTVMFLVLCISDFPLEDQYVPNQFPSPSTCNVTGCNTAELTFYKQRVIKAGTQYVCRVVEFPKGGPYHMVLLVGSKLNARNIPGNQFFPCETMDPGFSIMTAWAKGQKGPQWFPKDTGLLFGENTVAEIGILQIHYDNIDLDTGFYDSSGMRLYYTPRLMPTNAGNLISGSESINLKPGLERVQVVSNCPLGDMIENPVQIAVFAPHAHKYARRIWVEVIRNGKQTQQTVNNGLLNLPNSVTSSNQSTIMETTGGNLFFGTTQFRFDDQQAYFPNTNLILYPNDTLQTICEYDTTSTDKEVQYSLSTIGEMCQVHTFVYPTLKSSMICKDAYNQFNGNLVSQEISNSKTFSWVSFSSFWVPIGIWVSIKLTSNVMAIIWKSKWESCNEERRRGIAVHVVSFFVLTAIFIVQLLNVDIMYIDTITLTQMYVIRGCSMVLAYLYVIELSYRNLRPDVLLHHFFTIFTVLWLINSTEFSGNTKFLKIGYFWIFFASGEQLQTVGLILHKLDYFKPASITLFIASWQVLLMKLVFTGLILKIWYLDVYAYSGTDSIYTSSTIIIAFLLTALVFLTVQDSQTLYAIAKKDWEKSIQLVEENAKKDTEMGNSSDTISRDFAKQPRPLGLVDTSE